MWIKHEDRQRVLSEYLRAFVEPDKEEQVAQLTDALLAEALNLRLGAAPRNTEVLAVKLVVDFLAFDAAMNAAHHALARLYEHVPSGMWENGADISQATDEAWGLCVWTLEES